MRERFGVAVSTPQKRESKKKGEKMLTGLNRSVTIRASAMKGVHPMGESEARKKWQKENTVFIGVKLQKSTDADILRFLENKQNQTAIKIALREYIANHPEA